MTLMAVTDDLRAARNEHYLHMTFRVEIGTQEPKIMEPEACTEWAWFDLAGLPEIFSFHAKVFATIHSGRVYSGI